MFLNEQVRRNLSRFPEDFMFQLTESEAHLLRSQIATSKEGRGGRRYLPYAFTEQGVAMLSKTGQAGLCDWKSEIDITVPEQNGEQS